MLEKCEEKVPGRTNECMHREASLRRYASFSRQRNCRKPRQTCRGGLRGERPGLVLPLDMSLGKLRPLLAHVFVLELDRRCQLQERVRRSRQNGRWWVKQEVQNDIPFRTLHHLLLAAHHDRQTDAEEEWHACRASCEPTDHHGLGMLTHPRRGRYPRHVGNAPAAKLQGIAQ